MNIEEYTPHKNSDGFVHYTYKDILKDNIVSPEIINSIKSLIVNVLDPIAIIYDCKLKVKTSYIPNDELFGSGKYVELKCVDEREANIVFGIAKQMILSCCWLCCDEKRDPITNVLIYKNWYIRLSFDKKWNKSDVKMFKYIITE